MDCEMIWELIQEHLLLNPFGFSVDKMNVSLDAQEIRALLLEVLRKEFKSNVGPSTSVAGAIADLQSELDKTKVLLTERTAELNQLKDIFQESLAKIDSKCAKTNSELTHEDENRELNAEGSSVKCSVRKMLEEVCSEIINVKTQLQQVRENCSCTRSAGVGSDESGQLPQNTQDAQAIRANTHEEELQILTKEYDNARNMLSDPADGDTLSGKSVAEISNDVPLVKGNQVTLTIEIINLLSVPLTNSQIYIHSGEAYNAFPAKVKGGTREVATFRGGVPTVQNVPGGAMSYRVGLTGVQLLIYYFSNKSKRSVLGLGLTMAELPVKTYFDTCSLGCSSLDYMRPDKRYLSVENKDEITTAMVKLQNLRARVTIAPSSRSVWTVEILSIKPEGIPKTLRFEGGTEFGGGQCSQNGETLAGRSITEMLATIYLAYGCVVEISNGLKVSLENPSKHLLEGDLRVTVARDSREVLIFTHDTVVDGMLTYQIEGTDLRLAVAIRCQESGNSFAIGFIPARSITGQPLMEALMDSSYWKTRPERQYALANDGQQVVEIRNIVARAAMASEPKALVKIYITTF